MTVQSAKPTHHPSADILAAYAAGTMRAGFDLVIAAHLSNCARCRDEMACLESAGGTLLVEGESAALSNDALTRTLDRLSGQAPASETPRSIDSILAMAKRRWVAPGVWTAKLDTPHAPDDRIYLLGAAPRVATARHSHEGPEFTLILQGALQDGDDIYRAGDFCERDKGAAHHPKVHGNEPCICLFATQGRLRPASVLGRIAFSLAGV